MWQCLCTSPGKSAIKSLSLPDCSAQMTAGCPGHSFLEQGGVIKSSQNPWMLRFIFSGHRNTSLLPPAGNYLPARVPCTFTYSHDLHVAKAVSPPCDCAGKTSRETLAVAVTRLGSHFFTGSCSLSRLRKSLRARGDAGKRVGLSW